jgi:hypothetical protein
MRETASTRWLRRMARSGGEYVAARAGALAEHPAGSGANGSANGQAGPPPPPPIAPEPGSPARFARELLPVRATEEDQIVSRRLYERPSAEDVSEIEEAIAKGNQLQAYYSAPTAATGCSRCSASACG